MSKYTPTYTLIDEMMASPTEIMPAASRMHQLTAMWQGLRAIELDANPTRDDWRVCSDAVNLMETLVLEMKVTEDMQGLLMDAVTALAKAGQRHKKTGAPIRLDAAGIKAVRAVLEDYATMLEAIPHRTMIRCHRLTEKRIREVLRGKRRAHDVEVMDL